LCWRCALDPALRELYPSTSKFGRWAIGAELDFMGAGAEPEPTQAWPGTPDKIAVLAARVAARQQLFHPADGADVDLS
jgi:hypothetical protein